MYWLKSGFAFTLPLIVFGIFALFLVLVGFLGPDDEETDWQQVVQARGMLTSTPDDEYEVVAHVHSGVRAKIRDLEGFIGKAPQIQQRRKRETQVTLPPLEDDAARANC